MLVKKEVKKEVMLQPLWLHLPLLLRLSPSPKTQITHFD
jgi:hypothetical protein